MLRNKIKVKVMGIGACSIFLLPICHAHAQTLRDPTLPGQGFVTVSKQANQQALVLNSIVNGQHAYAVINSRILSVGDTISGLRVSSIGKDFVTLSDGRKLQLFQSITER